MPRLPPDLVRVLGARAGIEASLEVGGSFTSRAERPPQSWINRSASVYLPWSIWAMMEKLRMRERGCASGEFMPGLVRGETRKGQAGWTANYGEKTGELPRVG